ncbi:hypothetical protein GCM10010275_63130 [Streptomyces litmocidini]|nr:hypothetical protein GCM10010275_63130 [Streptomyces litmocidini]
MGLFLGAPPSLVLLPHESPRTVGPYYVEGPSRTQKVGRADTAQEAIAMVGSDCRPTAGPRSAARPKNWPCSRTEETGERTGFSAGAGPTVSADRRSAETKAIADVGVPPLVGSAHGADSGIPLGKIVNFWPGIA